MAVSGFVNVNISSMERRFELSSSESGLIPSSYDIVSALSILPISYFGGLGSKPRYIGILYFVFGVGAVGLSLPHFFTGLYVSGSDSLAMCDVNTSFVCDANPSTLSDYKVIVLLNSTICCCL